MKETIATFIDQHETAITDLAFLAGYLLFITALTILILFFCLRYIRKHQKPDEKMIKGYTRRSLLTLFDLFLNTFIYYAAFTMGTKAGLLEENRILFNVMPPALFSLIFIPVLLFGFFTAIFICDKFLDGKIGTGTLYLFDRITKRGDHFDDTKNTDISDIPDSDTSCGFSDDHIHHDRYSP